MRAILLGNKDLAVHCLEACADAGIELAGVVLNPDDDGVEDGRWYRSLRRAAETRGLDVLDVPNVSSPDGHAFVAARAPDLLLSASYTRIVRPEILDLARVAPLNLHFGDLPHYRGCLPLVHAMAAGEAAVGVTLHVMDAGIDTGDVVARRRVAVTERDTAFTLYFKCVEAGSILMHETLPALRDGTWTRTPQDLGAGSYHPQVYPRDRWLDPAMSATALSGFVRAHTFLHYPSARAMIDGVERAVTYGDAGFSVPELGLGPAPAEEILAALCTLDWQSPWPNESPTPN